MTPGSSGTPGHGPQHHLDLSGTLSQTELPEEDPALWVWGWQDAWDSSLRFGQQEVNSLPSFREVGTGGGSAPPSEGAAGDQQSGQNLR